METVAEMLWVLFPRLWPGLIQFLENHFTLSKRSIAVSCLKIELEGDFCGIEMIAVSCGLKYSSSTSSG